MTRFEEAIASWDWGKYLTPDWIGAATGVLALVVSSIALFLLLRSMKATQKALELSAEANEVTKLSVEETRVIGRAQTRAYLRIEEVMLLYDEAGEGLAFRLRCHNAGQTPARNMEATARIQFNFHDEGHETEIEMETAIGMPDLSAGAAEFTTKLSTRELEAMANTIVNATPQGNGHIQGEFVVFADDVFNEEVYATFEGHILSNVLPEHGPNRIMMFEQVGMHIIKDNTHRLREKHRTLCFKRSSQRNQDEAS